MLWSLPDHLNTVRDVVEYITGTVSVVKHVVFDAFGQVVTDTAPGVVLLPGYTGKLLDPETGLQYNINRWYDARTGRWMSTDPIGFAAADANLYRYVGNGVLWATDPRGLQDFPRPVQSGWHYDPPQRWLGPEDSFSVGAVRSLLKYVTSRVSKARDFGKSAANIEGLIPEIDDWGHRAAWLNKAVENLKGWGRALESGADKAIDFLTGVDGLLSSVEENIDAELKVRHTHCLKRHYWEVSRTPDGYSGEVTKTQTGHIHRFSVSGEFEYSYVRTFYVGSVGGGLPLLLGVKADLKGNLHGSGAKNTFFGMSGNVAGRGKLSLQTALGTWGGFAGIFHFNAAAVGAMQTDIQFSSSILHGRMWLNAAFVDPILRIGLEAGAQLATPVLSAAGYANLPLLEAKLPESQLRLPFIVPDSRHP